MKYAKSVKLLIAYGRARYRHGVPVRLQYDGNQTRPSIAMALFVQRLLRYYCTLPFTVNVLTGVFVLDLTVNCFVKGPFAAALYVTVMVPDSPGLIGVFVNSATEHPHEGFTSLMMMGASPLLANLKSKEAGWFCGMLPKSCVSFSNLNSPIATVIAVKLTTAINAIKIPNVFFIIFILICVLQSNYTPKVLHITAFISFSL
ncbi:hypothetical protein FM107_13310 [Sphingobacterium sp. JB170]|nr:hypothetical protein FM107_13310 [Sphingobacterium sp. JB170]